MLFVFMTYGLYNGMGLIDNYPKFRDFKSGDLFSKTENFPDIPSVHISDGIGSLILSILLWWSSYIKLDIKISTIDWILEQ